MARCIRAVGRWRWSVLVRGCGVQGCPWSGRGRHSGAPQVNDHQNPCVPAVRGLIAYLTLVLLYFLHLCARVRNVVSASFLLSLSLSSAPNPAAFRLANDRRIKETTGFYSCLTSVMKWQSRLPSAPRHRFMGLITASLCASTVIQDRSTRGSFTKGPEECAWHSKLQRRPADALDRILASGLSIRRGMCTDTSKNRFLCIIFNDWCVENASANFGTRIRKYWRHRREWSVFICYQT